MTQNLAAATSLLPKVLYSGQLAGTAATTLYTVPAGTAAILKQGVVCNTGSTIATFTLSILPSGAAVDGTHRLISAYSLAAGDSLPLADYLGGACMGPGDFINAQASIGAVLDVFVTGVESS